MDGIVSPVQRVPRIRQQILCKGIAMIRKRLPFTQDDIARVDARGVKAFRHKRLIATAKQQPNIASNKQSMARFACAVAQHRIVDSQVLLTHIFIQRLTRIACQIKRPGPHIVGDRRYEKYDIWRHVRSVDMKPYKLLVKSAGFHSIAQLLYNYISISPKSDDK